jgi:Flp pilus assembly protein TadG
VKVITFSKSMPKRGGRETGQALVEFMLTVTFLVLLTLAVLEIADFIYTYSVLADAANEGVRYAIVHGSSSSGANGPSSGTAGSPPCNSGNAALVTGSSVSGITNAVQNFAAFSLHSASNTNVYVCYFDGNNKLLSRVQVTVSYQYQPFFFKWPSVTVFANSAGRIVF